MLTTGEGIMLQTKALLELIICACLKIKPTYVAAKDRLQTRQKITTVYSMLASHICLYIQVIFFLFVPCF